MSPIPKLIKAKRKNLMESQLEFSKRFGVSHVAVSDWESGKSEAPYSVLEFVLELPTVCPTCNGEGFLNPTQPK